MKTKILSQKVDYDLAKKLAEKGFDETTRVLYHYNGSDYVNIPNKNSENLGFSAPTIGEVLDWIFDKKKIIVNVDVALCENKGFYFNCKYTWVRMQDDRVIGYQNIEQITPKRDKTMFEAYTSAINLILNDFQND
jgi:hypothetical protein